MYMIFYRNWWFSSICQLVFRSSHIFVFWFLVFWSLYLHDFLSRFFPSYPSCLAKCKQRLWFCIIFVARSDQKRKMGWTKQWTTFLSTSLTALCLWVKIKKKKCYWNCCPVPSNGLVPPSRSWQFSLINYLGIVKQLTNGTMHKILRG